MYAAHWCGGWWPDSSRSGKTLNLLRFSGHSLFLPLLNFLCQVDQLTRSMLLVGLCVAVFLASSAAGAASMLGDERSALNDLYRATGGHQRRWIRWTNWNDSMSAPCTRFGVVC